MGAHLFRIFRIAGSVILIGFLALRIDWHELSVAFSKATAGPIVAAIAVSFFSIILLSIRLLLSLRTIDVAIDFPTSLRLTWSGQFFNCCLPGSTGGDFYKAYEACRLFPNKKPAVITALITDRLFALTALFLMATLSLLFLPYSWLKTLAEPHSHLLFPVLGMTALALFFFVFFAKRIKIFLSARLNFVRIMAESSKRYIYKPSKSLLIFGIAILVHFLNFCSFYLLSNSLHIGLSLLQVMGLMPVLFLLLLIPITVNGHGLREIIMIGYFSTLSFTTGTPQTLAVALSIVFVANDLLCATPGGILYLVNSGKKRIWAS